MQFDPPLIEGHLIRRYKRFLADIALRNGEVVVAHCPNPGAMHTCMTEGGRVWLTRSRNTKRKLAYTWEIAEVADAMVCVNTTRANDLVAEALSVRAIEPLRDYERVTREVRYGDGSRVDFLLERGYERCYVEVKSVTLKVRGRTAAFPDSVSVRATKHANELMRMVAEGHRAMLLFCCNRTDADVVEPADEIDPVYGYTLRKAMNAGVEVHAVGASIFTGGMRLDRAIQLRIPMFDYRPPMRRTTSSGRGGKKQPRRTASNRD